MMNIVKQARSSIPPIDHALASIHMTHNKPFQRSRKKPRAVERWRYAFAEKYMRLLIIAVLTTLAMVGCASKEESGTASPSVSVSDSTDGPSQYMAYEHSIRLDVEEAKIASVHEAAEAACRAAAAEQCVILMSQLDTGRDVSAALKFRATPSGIRDLIAAIGSQGDIISQSVTGEDLATPIEDSAKKLAMLTDYQSKLEALEERASSDIDALIKVNKELASVQSDIEAMTGHRAHLIERVETELLNVFISSTYNRSFWKPIATATSDFGHNLSEGIESAIYGVAFLLPWSLILLVFGWAARKLWLRTKKRNANA